MENELIKLSESGDHDGLQKALQTIPLTQVFKVLRGEATKQSSEFVPILKVIFHSNADNSTEVSNRRLDAYKFSLSVLQKSDLPVRTASELLGILLLETDAFPSSSLAELAELLVNNIKNGTSTYDKWLEILPKVITTLSSRDVVIYDGNSMSGTEYKSHIINSICSSRWECGLCIQLASMFRDIPLTSSELSFVVQKLLKMLPAVEFLEVPPLVYQLLLLAVKGSRRQILLGLMSFFNEHDSKLREQVVEISIDSETPELTCSKESVCHTEGTVLLYITYAAKQDQELGKEFLKILKVHQHQPFYIFTPFVLGLALSLTKMQRIEEQVMEVLKSSVIRHFRENEKKYHSDWLREMIPRDYDISSLILETVENSKYGWDHVTQGLIQFSFTLLDSFGPKGAFGRVTNGTRANVSPADRACSLGGRILQETFKAHTIVRSEILEQILNRVVTKTFKPIFHYVEALAQTICSAPQLFLDSLTKLKEVLDYLPFLPHSSAVSLIRALTPLMKICPSLRDSFMLVLRKALFNRELETRKIAVSGFLVVLRNFKVSGGLPLSQTQNCHDSFISMSQVQIDISVGSSKSIAAESVCLELLGTLRRVLAQQSDVKQLLYEGLFVVLFKNPQLANAILELLASQFQKYYEGEEDDNLPFKLNNCVKTQVDKTFLVEPLAHLISTIQQCVVTVFKKHGFGDADEEDDLGFRRGSYILLKNSLDSLVKSMISAELEDFELDKSAEYGNSNSVGEKNQLMTTLLLGIYETLLEYRFMIGDFSTESCEDVLSLFTKYQKLMEVLQEKTGSSSKKSEGKGRKGSGIFKSSSNKTYTSLLTLKCFAAIMYALFCDMIPNHQEGLMLLRGHQDFVNFIIRACNLKFMKLQETYKSEPSNSDKIFKYLSTIGRALLKQCNVQSTTNTLVQQEKSTSLLILECLSQLISWICVSFQNQLNTFLCALETGDNSMDADTNQDQTYDRIKLFQSLVVKILGDTNEQNHSLKEVIPLLSIISVLSKHLPLGSDGQHNVHMWAKQLCMQQNIEDNGVAKALLQLCLFFSHQGKVCVTLLRDVAFDVHYHLGDIDEEIEVKGSTFFCIINQRTAVSVIAIVLQHTEQILEETDWIMNSMKSDINVLTVTSELGKEAPVIYDRKQEEHSICTRLGHLITAFHEVVQTALPSDACIENSLKLLAHLYNTLTNLAKYYLIMYAQKVGHLSSWFEKLVKLSGRHLTPQVYALITYVQASEGSPNNSGDKKKQKRDSLAEKAKVFREAKTVPPLIFAIEQYERHLIQLSKKSKVNLMVHFKLSTSRDFRINTATVEAVLEQQSESDEERNENNTENIDSSQVQQDETVSDASRIQCEVTNAEPPAKRKKAERLSKLGIRSKKVKN